MKFGIDVIIRGRASSTFDVATIDRRLAAIADRTDADAVREREFLTDLRRRIAPKE